MQYLHEVRITSCRDTVTKPNQQMASHTDVVESIHFMFLDCDKTEELHFNVRCSVIIPKTGY